MSVWLLVTALTFIWTLLHVISTSCILNFTLVQTGNPKLSSDVAARLRNLPLERLRTLRRMVRAQLYYIIAGPVGVWLLLQSRSLSDLNQRYTDWHDRAFALALSHWIISLFEDVMTPNGFKLWLPAPKKVDATTSSSSDAAASGASAGFELNLHNLYLLHHLVAIIAYASCLHLHALPALGACGLAFELPVAFLNLRDLLRGFQPEVTALQRPIKPAGLATRPLLLACHSSLLTTPLLEPTCGSLS